MDPNRKEPLDKYEKNAKIMYYVGFGLMPLVWLMCWVYSNKRSAESEFLKKLSKRCLILFWISMFILGAWTTIYHAFYTDMTVIGLTVPSGVPE